MSTTFHVVPRRRGGVTLIELLAVLAVLGVMVGGASLAFRVAHVPLAPEAAALDRIAIARRRAIVTGRAVVTTVMLGDRPHAVTAYPDGRVLGDSIPSLDPLSGRPRSKEQGHAHP